MLAAAAVTCALCPADSIRSGVSPNAVSLPTGPGSIRGLGEDFEPNLNTGTAKYAIDIELPRGANGFAPENLGLTYDSGNGNGVLGYGWEMPLPHVQRRDFKPLPRYVDGPNGLDDDRDGEVDEIDEVDLFVSEIHQAPLSLVARDDGYYFGQREEAFIRYSRDEDAWQGNSPTGVSMRFGDSPESRITNPDTGGIYYWAISEARDPNGNVIRYTYTSYDEFENANQIYLSKVEYGAGEAPWDNFHFVVYEYEARQDVIENCRPGFCIRIGKRLKSIFVGTQGPELEGHQEGDFNGDGITDYLNRRYDLTYEMDAHWSLLTTVTLAGADGITGMPPMRMEYSVCVPAISADASAAIIGVENPPPRLFDNPNIEVTELNGDGLPDMLETNPLGGPHKAYLNRGEQPDLPRRILWSDAIPIGGDPRAQNLALGGAEGLNISLSDFNGDGRADLVYRAGQFDMYYYANVAEPATDGVSWATRQRMNLHPGESAPPSPGYNDDILRVDLNDDKRGDIIQAVDATSVVEMRVWLNLGGGRFAKPYMLSTDLCCSFSQQGVHLVDFNGDGVPDVVRVSVQGLEVAPGLGYGYVGEPAFIPIPEMLLNDWQRERAELVDITGDGLPELVVERAEPGTLWYWINLGNYSMDQKRVIGGLPPLTGISLPEVSWADMNGNGTDDLVYAHALLNPRMQIIDLGELLGCVPSPNLLTRIDNGLGRQTVIVHESSARFVLADRAAGQPWPNPMPFNVDVVSKLADYDSLGNEYIKRYSYRDGYYQPDFQRFAGFAEVTIEDEGEITAPTEIIRHAFDIGKTHYEMLGTLLAVSHETLNGGVFYRQENSWTARTLFTGVNGVASIFPQLDATRQTNIELGAGAPIETLREFAYDAFGNQTAIKDYGVADGTDFGVGNDERLTVTEYAINEDAWMLRSPSREEIHALDGTVLARTEYYYDDETFAGDNYGAISRGTRTLIRRWHTPEEPEGFVDAMRARYDAYGNAIVLLDALALAPGGVLNDTLGHYRTVEYDPGFHALPVGEIIHIGGETPDLSLTAEYDPGLGVVTASVDYSGHRTEHRYDVFGRLTQTFRPGDSPDYPTLEYAYAPAVPFGSDGVINYVETRILDQAPGTLAEHLDHYHLEREFMDGLGRRVMQKREAAVEPGSGAPRFAVSYAAIFNGRGGVRSELQPCFSLAGPSLESLLEFEDVTAPAWQGQFHENGTLVSYSLAEAHRNLYTYDELQRQRTVTYADGTTNEKRYAPLVTRTYDALDLDPVSAFFDTPIAHFEDGLGRLVRVDEVVRLTDEGLPSPTLSTWTTRYAYRADGPLLRITDAQGNEKWYEYDGLGRKTYMNDYNRGEMEYAYDAAGNLIETIDAKAQRITYTYDGTNRKRTVDYHDESDPFSAGYAYDPAQPLSETNRPDIAWFHDIPAGPLELGGGTTVTAENTAGKLAFAWDTSGETHFSYDPRGNSAWTAVRARDTETDAWTWYRTELHYDVQDRVSELVYPDGDLVTYAYTAGGQIAELGGGEEINAGGTPFLLHGSDYAPSTAPARFVFGNGVETILAYDVRQRLSRMTGQPASSPGTTLLDFAYTYDPASNISAIADERPDFVLPDGDPRRNSQHFAYDDRNRLIEASFSLAAPGVPFVEAGRINYRYDRIGNLLAQDSLINQEDRGYSVTNPGSLEYGGALGASNRIGRTTDDPGAHAVSRAVAGDVERTFDYDANGNVTAMDGLALTYDYEDHVLEIEDAQMRVEYAYNFDGRRARKRVWTKDSEGARALDPTDTVTYVDRHFEVRAHGQPVKYVYSGGQRIAKITGTIDDTADRTQWLRLREGWNLFSLAIDAPDAATQLGAGFPSGVQALFIANGVTGEVSQADSSTPLPPGSILWAYTETPLTLPVTGTYARQEDPVPLTVGFAVARLLDSLQLDGALPAAADGSVWAFDAGAQAWQSRPGPVLPELDELPETLKPGQPIYVLLGAPAELTVPPATRGVLYYHNDHVDSAAVLSDGTGTVVEETVYYPYGAPRNQYRSADAPENPYQFAQKERDRETGLHYFEARYLAAPLARFLQVDPAVETVPDAALLDPQALQAYGYGRGNPLTFRDPAGRFLQTKVAQSRLRALNPFGDSVPGNAGLKLSERRARVFGELKVAKGGSLPKGDSLSTSFILNALKEDLEGIKEANTALASIAQMAENIGKMTSEGGKGKLDASAFLKLLTKDRKIGGVVPDGATLTEGGRIVLSSDEFIKKNVSDDFAKAIEGLDFDKKYEELSGIANKALQKKGFDFKMDDVNSFIDKYLNTSGDVADSDGDGIPNTADGNDGDQDKDSDSE